MAGLKPIVFLGLLILTGCASKQYEMALPGELPAVGRSWEIEASPYFSELKRTYGKGLVYERTKIKYLLGHTGDSKYQFDRNGRVYDGKTTAKHLTKKYRQRLEKVKTAQYFIDFIASKSSVSGRPYLALPGDGRAYRTGDILNDELRRLESFMDGLGL